MDEKVKERIKFNVEVIKILALLFVATGGGAVSLIIAEKFKASYAILAVAGMLFAFCLGILAISDYNQTKKLLL
jgi:hypothetical protein